MTRSTRIISFCLALAGSLLFSLSASAHRVDEETDLVIHDVTADHDLTVYEHEGRNYVAGTPGHKYEVRIYNRVPTRALAVVSVDGLNVLTGKPAHPSQGGYVVPAFEQVGVDGWRKSLSEVAAFTFTSIPDSYAARTGQAQNVGVIGAALFRERAYIVRERRYSDRVEEGVFAPHNQAPSSSQEKSSERSLGTGHGPRQDSNAREVAFERASPHPDRVLTIYYDSEASLRRRGIIPSEREPEAFPGQFVPDP